MNRYFQSVSIEETLGKIIGAGFAFYALMVVAQVL